MEFLTPLCSPSQYHECDLSAEAYNRDVVVSYYFEKWSFLVILRSGIRKKCVAQAVPSMPLCGWVGSCFYGAGFGEYVQPVE